MGKLEELEEELYDKETDPGAERRKRQFIVFPSGKNVQTSWGAYAPRRGIFRHLAIPKATAVVLLGAFLFLAGAAVFVFVYLGSERREAEVIIASRDLIEGGESFTLPVTFRNIASVQLEEAELAVTLPPNSFIRDESGLERPAPGRIVRRIGTLVPGEEGKSEFIIRLFGREGEEKEIAVQLLYRPAGLRARFSSQSIKRVTISRVPLVLYWEIPETVSVRQEIPVTLRASSQAQIPFGNLWLRLDYPSGLALVSALPPANTGDTLWNIGTLAPGEEKAIVLKVRFGGAGGETQSLHAGLGAFNELTKEWRPWRESTREVKISAAPFLLESTLEGRREGTVKPGDLMNVAIRYHNRSSVPVKDISIRAALEGDIIDPASLSIGDGGVFDFSSQTIVWGPSGTEALKEVRFDSGGELHFQIKARERPLVRTSADKNLTIKIRTRIEAPRLPQELEGSQLSPDDAVEFKVATIALASGRAVHRTSPIPNSGPLPPRVGEKTTYTVVWEARSFTNEVENARISASLPPNVRWEGIVSPQDAGIRFDQAAGAVQWQIGKIPPGTGVLSPARIGAFQVSVIPSEIDAGKALALVTDPRFSGRDTFTGEEIVLQMDNLDIRLKDDPATNPAEWVVAR